MKVKISTSPTQSELEEIDLSSTTRRGAECIIGRSPDSDIVLESNDVSRHHGKFFYHSGNYYFSDLGSKNGTILNGKQLEHSHSQILKNGDVIRIGDFALMMEEDIAVSEQSETVVRIINPSMFSNWQGSQGKDVSSELVNQQQESEPVAEEEVNTSGETTFVQPDEVAAESSTQESIYEITEESPESDEIELEDNSLDEEQEELQLQNQQESPESEEIELEDNSLDEEQEELQLQNQQESPESEEIELEDNSSEEEQEELQNQQQSPESEEIELEDNSLDEEQDEQQTQKESSESEVESEIMEVKNNDNVDIEIADKDEVAEELVSEIASIAKSDVAQESEEIEEESQEEEEDIKIAQILEEKRIVLIAHDTKKSDLKELVAQHEEFLSYCQTVTWQTYNNYLQQETGLSVTEDIPPATSGGYQAINSMINSEKIIAVIFLRDLIVPQSGQASEEALLRACNIREILLANNLPTAQAVIHYLKNMTDS
ncbi:MAG: FHA domain-containing protein [Rivularia sp. (in: cyanobacteria)]